MRLITKTHDYYDIGVSYGIDPNVIFNRFPRNEELKKNSPLHKELKPMMPFWFTPVHRNHVWGKIYIEYFAVFFCGKAYPGVCCYALDKPTKYFYDIEDVDEWRDEHKIPWGKIEKNRHAWWNRPDRNDIAEWMEAPKEIDESVVHLHFKHQTPIIVVREDRVFFDALLDKLMFYRVFDSWSAFQELNMFVSGVMGGQSPPMLELTNNERIAKHGFDDWSFRKMPTKHQR